MAEQRTQNPGQTQSDRSAIGGDQSTMGGKVRFNTPVTDIANLVKEGEAIVIHRKFQSDEPQVLSTGSQEQTRQLFQQVNQSYAWNELTPTS